MEHMLFNECGKIEFNSMKRRELHLTSNDIFKANPSAMLYFNGTTCKIVHVFNDI